MNLRTNPFFTNCRREYFSTRHRGNCLRCSTCAYLFIENRISGAHSLVSDPTGIIRLTDKTIFTVTRPHSERKMSQMKKAIASKCAHIERSTLLQGTSLYHTERELDLDAHVESQTNLMVDTYNTLIDPDFQIHIRHSEKMELVINDELIMYSELTHPIERALSNGDNKITHPHSWVRANMAIFGNPHTLIHFPETGMTESQFIAMTVNDGTDILGENPESKVYVKYFLDVKTFLIKRCEIDVEPPRRVAS